MRGSTVTDPTPEAERRKWRAVKLDTITVWGVRSSDGREMVVAGVQYPTADDARELARHLNRGGQ